MTSTVTYTQQPSKNTTPDLLRTFPRLLRWTPFLVSFGMVVGLLLWRSADVTSSEGSLWLIRIAAIVTCLGAVFVLDDPSVAFTESVPTLSRVRLGWRCVILVAMVMAGTLLAVAMCSRDVELDQLWGGLACELAAFIAIITATGLVLQRQMGIPEPGQFAGAGLAITVALGQVLAARWPMFVGPGPDWFEAHVRWLLVAVAGTAVASWQMKDPGARGWRSLHW